MGENLNAIKADLISANEKITKIAADVQRLHDAIAAAGEVPTPEEWAEVKQISADLNTALQAVDDVTPE